MQFALLRKADPWAKIWNAKRPEGRASKGNPGQYFDNFADAGATDSSSADLSKQFKWDEMASLH